MIEKDIRANIFDIERNSFVDGPGIRTIVFFKGCNMRCQWCHNPESLESQPQVMFYKDKCIGCGKCEISCPVDARRISGKEYSVMEVFDIILEDKIFYEASGGGVTFSGGECMLQIDFLYAILKKCKEHGIHTAVDTAGNVSFSHFEKILPYVDLFLYDVKSMDDEVHRRYVGTGNMRILDNLRKLLELDKNIWIRVPLIAKVNDSKENMKKLLGFIREHGSVEKIELLPYHAMGKPKYDALGIMPASFQTPDREVIAELEKMIVNF